MTYLLIIFILNGSRWEFSNIERISDFVNAEQYCNHLAAKAHDSRTYAICVPDEGEEA